MRLIQQQEQFDCGIALVAMLSDCSYATALDVYKGPWILNKGLRWQRLCRMLYVLTGDKWTTRSHFDALGGPLLWSFSHTLSPTGFLIYPPDGRDSHWVAVSNGWIYDPAAKKRLGWRDSPLCQWHVVRVIRRSAAYCDHCHV